MKKILIPLLLAAAGYPIGGTTVQVGTTGARPVAIIGSGAQIIDVASIAAGGCNDNQITLTGATVGSPCIVGFAGKTTGVTFICRVSASNTVQLQSCSPVIADPPSQSYNFVVFNN